MTTQRVNASYQEIIDLHTESDRVSVLGFHTPCNFEPVNLLKPFWAAYQKVKYLGCSMALVPAARLPADPLQVSYASGEPTIDPRDMLNPILFHGCHGNDMGSILNQFYSGADGNSTDVERYFSDSLDNNMVRTNYVGNLAVYESLYYRALTDNTWLKAHPQRGFRKRMHPMVYRVAVNTSLNPNTAGGTLMPYVARDDNIPNGIAVDDGDRDVGRKSTLGTAGAAGNVLNDGLLTSSMPGLQKTNVDVTPGVGYTTTWSNPLTFSAQQWMTPGIRPLGWIDTRQPTSGTPPTQSFSGDEVPNYQLFAEKVATNYDVLDNRYNLIPKVFMGLCLLPPAYKTEQYFRIVLNHHFAFAKYRGTSMRNNGHLAAVGNVVNMYGSDYKKDDRDGGDDFGSGFDDSEDERVFDD